MRGRRHEQDWPILDKQEFRRRLANRPTDVRFEELQRLLVLYGWELDTIRGSHHVFKRNGREVITIPLRRPRVLFVYVKWVMELTGDDDQ